MSELSARYAVCEQVLRQGSFADDVALARAAGIPAIGVDDAAVAAIGVEEAARILDGEGVQASSYMGLGTVLQDDGAPASLREVARRLDVAAGLGAPGALVVTGALGERDPSETEATCREWLRGAATLAADREVRIMLEPIHPLLRDWSFVHTLRDALSWMDGLDGGGVVLDLGHVWSEDGLDALVRANVDDIVSVQVTNVDPAALAQSRYERAPLPDGGVPVASLVGLLETAGYRGWYEDETLIRIPRERRLAMLRASRDWFGAL